MATGTAAGHIAQAASGELITGKVGKDLTVEEGYAAAQRVALSLMATLKSASPCPTCTVVSSIVSPF